MSAVCGAGMKCVDVTMATMAKVRARRSEEQWWNVGKRHTNTHQRPSETTSEQRMFFLCCFCCILKMVFAALLTHVINIYTVKETGARCHVEMISQRLYSTYRVLSQKPKDKEVEL